MNLKEILEQGYEIHIKKEDRELNYLKINGNPMNLLGGLSLLVNQFKGAGIKTEDIKYAVELGLKDDNEIEKQTNDSLKNMLDKLF